MTNSRSPYFTIEIGGGDADDEAVERQPFDEVLNWSVSLLYELDDGDPPVDSERRVQMLQALRGLSPVLTIASNTVALTLLASGTRDSAAMRGVEAGWTCLEAGDVNASLVGLNLITHEQVDACVDAGIPFIYDTETERAADFEAAREEIRDASPADYRAAAHPEADQATALVDFLTSSGHGRPVLPDLQNQWLTVGTYARSNQSSSLMRLADVFPKAFPAPVAQAGPDLFCASRSRFSGILNHLKRAFAATTNLDELDDVQSAIALSTMLATLEVIAEQNAIVNQKAAADILGVTKQRAHQLLRASDAPRPLTYLDGNPIWLRWQIEEMRDTRGAHDTKEP